MHLNTHSNTHRKHNTEKYIRATPRTPLLVENFYENLYSSSSSSAAFSAKM